jgi:NDP-sugar pyrophosphorylase family protein
MRAILIATGGRDGAAPLIDRYPDPLLPLLDRPFLQHVIEYLARQGIRHFDIVLSHRPEVVERYFGDGTRWGCTFTYHLARDPERPYRTLRTLDVQGEEPILLGHADRLPSLDADAITRSECGTLPLVSESDSGEVAWTGWTRLSPEDFSSIDPDWVERDLAAHLLTLPANHVVERGLDTGTFGALLASQQMVLSKQFAPLFLTGREIEPGVWLSRNVSLHPTAKVTAPVFIGEDCRIGPDVQVGPHAVIGRGCILGRACVVTRALIFPENYVGADLELDNVVVDRNRILRGEGTAIETDAFLLGSLSGGRPNGRAVRLVSRLVALALLVVTAPVLFLTALWLRLTRPGPVLLRKEAVVIPEPAGARRRTCVLLSFSPSASAADGPGVRNILLDLLPALVSIVRGEMSFVGVRPRSAEEVEKLSPEWRSLYLSCKAGLITEENVGGSCSDDERYAAEAYYAAAGDWRYDLRLVCSYLRRALVLNQAARACPAV